MADTTPEIQAALAAYWDPALNNETISSPLRMAAALEACQQITTGLQASVSGVEPDSTGALTDCPLNTNSCKQLT